MHVPGLALDVRRAATTASPTATVGFPGATRPATAAAIITTTATTTGEDRVVVASSYAAIAADAKRSVFTLDPVSGQAFASSAAYATGKLQSTAAALTAPLITF
jgi:hypothetical protein